MVMGYNTKTLKGKKEGGSRSQYVSFWQQKFKKLLIPRFCSSCENYEDYTDCLWFYAVLAHIGTFVPCIMWNIWKE